MSELKLKSGDVVISAMVTVLMVMATLGCGASGNVSAMDAADDSGVPIAEKRCDPPGSIFTVYSRAEMDRFAGCTVLVGQFQQDSVRELDDFLGLESLHTIEGGLNVFRSPGFKTLGGLDNLEVVDGNLSIHLNSNLTSIAALAKLRLVTGNLYISSNDVLPQAEVDALAARVIVNGEKTLR